MDSKIKNTRFEFKNINGVKTLVIKDCKLMSPGIWNNLYYDSETIRQGYINTDWDDETNTYLYWDHNDDAAWQWAGMAKNIRIEKNNLVGDLYVVDDKAQKSLLVGVKWGISPKIVGRQVGNSVRDIVYKNFSFVTNPACKTTYLNRSNASDGGKFLFPNQFYTLNESGTSVADSVDSRVKGESMADEEKQPENKPENDEPAKAESSEEQNSSEEQSKDQKEENLEEKITLTKQELEEIIAKSVEQALKKKKYPYPETEKAKEKDKKYPYPEDEEMKKKKYPYPEKLTEQEMKAISKQDLEEAKEKELSEYTEFIKKFLKKNPGKTISDAAKAWKKEKSMTAEEKLSELREEIEALKAEKFELSAKPERLSVKAELNEEKIEDVDEAMAQFIQKNFLGLPIG